MENQTQKKEKVVVELSGKMVTVENFADHQIVLAMPGGDEKPSVFIPRCIKSMKENGEGLSKKPGTAEIDSGLLDYLKKNVKVVTGYFSAGVLRIVSASPPADAASPAWNKGKA